jgi:hypothetical protein
MLSPVRKNIYVRPHSALARYLNASKENGVSVCNALHELAARDEARNQMLEREKS